MIALPRSFPVIIVVGALMLWPKICSASEKEAVILLPRIYPPSDALEPAKDVFGDTEDTYAKILQTAFAEGLTTKARVRYVFEDPFGGTEGVVWISESAGRFRLNKLQSTRWLWRYTPEGRSQVNSYNNKLLPDDFRKVRLRRCSTGIPSKLAADIVTVWRGILRQARWPGHRETPPMDGGSITYSMIDNGQPLAGKVPPYSGNERRPKINLFWQLRDGMSAYCESGSPVELAEMKVSTVELLRTLAPGKRR